VTARRDGCSGILCTEHRRLRYSDYKKRWIEWGSVHRIRGREGHGAGVDALKNK